MFNEWNDHHRYTYNTSIFRLNTDINIPNKLKLRNELVAAENLKNKQWLLKTPKEIRARAVFEAHTRVITGIKQIKNKTIKFFKMSFKDKKFQKENGWCIDIPKQSIKKINNNTLVLYQRITKNSQIHLTEQFSGEIENDCKLQFDGIDLIPFKVTKTNIPDRNRMISLDPGVRTFLSGVDTDKRVEIGDKANEKMYPLLKKLDRYIGRAKTTTKKCQTKFKKRIKQLRKRIKNLQQELHKKASSWLCKNYSNIMIFKVLK
jgi:putative transposase